MTTEKSEKGQKSENTVTAEGHERSEGSEMDTPVDSGRRSIGATIGALLGFAAVSGISREALAQSAPVFPTGSGMTDVFWAVRIFALREYANAEGYQVAVLKGYDAIGDGGEGVFVWDALSTAADNTGIVVRPNAIAANEPGRWKRVVDGDWNVCWFGAKGDNATNNDDAFRAAIDAMSPATSRHGRALVVPPGNYRFANSLFINKSVILRGAGGSQGEQSTNFWFAPGVHGIEIGREFSSWMGMGAVVRNLYLYGDKRPSPPSGTLTIGVRIRQTSVVESVVVSGFEGNGFDIFGHAHPTSGNQTHSNHWVLRDCGAVLCGGHGLYVVGSDSSAGYSLGFAANDCGGWGIFDESDLGNTYIGSMVHACSLGPYKTTGVGGQSKTTMIGSYAEDGQPVSQLGGGTVSLGGYMNGVQGWHQDRHYVPYFQVATDQNAGTLGLGIGGLLSFSYPGAPSGDYTLSYYPVALDANGVKVALAARTPPMGWYAFKSANYDGYTALMFSGPEAKDGPGRAWLPNGYYIAAGQNRIRVTAVGSFADRPEVARLGDTVLHSSAGTTGPDGYTASWVCVRDKNANGSAVWRPVKMTVTAPDSAHLPRYGELGDVVINSNPGAGANPDIAQWHCVQAGNGLATLARWRPVRLDLAGDSIVGTQLPPSVIN